MKNHINNAYENSKLKLYLALKKKSPQFSSNELDTAIKDLNVGRARDPAGLCAKISKSNVTGTDLKESLLDMLNMIKIEGHIPESMRKAIITTIQKPGYGFKFKHKNLMQFF